MSSLFSPKKLRLGCRVDHRIAADITLCRAPGRSFINSSNDRMNALTGPRMLGGLGRLAYEIKQAVDIPEYDVAIKTQPQNSDLPSAAGD